MESAIELYKKHIGQYVTTAPSPFSNWLRGKILDVSEDGIALEFTVREEMTNPVKMLHGGMIAAIMDDMIGMTLFVTGVKNFYASVNLHVDFISNVRVGTAVVAKTSFIKKGKKVMLVECNLYGPENKLLARGTSNLVETEGTAYSHNL
jgi:uncharacterized protein (TIGR00369 family)